MNKITILTEKEIINRFNADWSKPMVTFLCTTYNHQDYIEDTIKGFLIQKTSFPYEILIHDDCSTDDTRKVIDSYKAKYPNLIKTIYQKQNQYSQGNPVTLIAAKQARAEYIALCEGDDYWINENKIEKQLNLLLSDPSITMLVSPGKTELNGRLNNKYFGYYGPKERIISAQEVLNISGQFALTSSYLLKKNYLIESRDLFKSAPVGDLFIELFNAVKGKLVYFPEVGSVYRLNAKNSWTESMSKNKLKNSLVFLNSMQDTILYSKSIEGFESLDWSVKTSANYYLLAREYLEIKSYMDFKKAIEISFGNKRLNNTQYMLYKSRKSEVLPILILRTDKLKSEVKSQLLRLQSFIKN